MTDPDVLLRANLTKIFPGERQPGRQQRGQITAVDRAEIILRSGEIVGLIGGNGSGKTTLLRLLAGTSQLTNGQVWLKWTPRVILSVGSNINPSMTARENIYLYGAMLGQFRRELSAMEEGILDFADLTEVADEPVRQFSLGMRLRLGFAIATAGEPRIILIDEVISAGDAAWQERGFHRLHDLRDRGAGLLIATHDLAAITKLADRVIWLEHGQIKKIGPAAEVVAAYQNSL